MLLAAHLRSDRFTPEPPLGAVRLDLHPIPMLHLSLMPGWHRRVGPGGNAAVGFTVGRAMLALGAEAWGLPAVNDAIARFRVSTGY